MLTTVHLCGPLGRAFGKRHRFHLQKPADVFKALSANFEDFMPMCSRLHQAGMAFRILIDSETVGEENINRLVEPQAPGSIRVVPVVGGAISRGGKIAINIVLAIATWGASTYFQGAEMAWLANGLRSMATYFAMNSLMLALSPILTKKTKQDKKENDPSSLFSNQDNVTTPGGPVPVGYGQMLVGSIVVGAGYELMTQDTVTEGHSAPVVGSVEALPDKFQRYGQANITLAPSTDPLHSYRVTSGWRATATFTDGSTYLLAFSFPNTGSVRQGDSAFANLWFVELGADSHQIGVGSTFTIINDGITVATGTMVTLSSWAPYAPPDEGNP